LHIFFKKKKKTKHYGGILESKSLKMSNIFNIEKLEKTHNTHKKGNKTKPEEIHFSKIDKLRKIRKMRLLVQFSLKDTDLTQKKRKRHHGNVRNALWNVF